MVQYLFATKVARMYVGLLFSCYFYPPNKSLDFANKTIADTTLSNLVHSMEQGKNPAAEISNNGEGAMVGNHFGFGG